MVLAKTAKLSIILLSSIIIIVLIGWYLLEDINTIKFIIEVITAVATVIIAISVYQLDITLNQLKLETLNKIYDMLQQNIKEDLNEITKWAEEKKVPKEILDSSKENFNKVLFVSAIFNRIGYYIYRGFIDERSIQEVFGGFILHSFVVIRPYLKYIHDKTESPSEPWIMRRYYLLAVVVCENYFINSREKSKIKIYYKKIMKNRCFEKLNEIKFKKYYMKILNDYGDEKIKEDLKRGSIVPKKWLDEDIQKWLERRGFIRI